MKQAEQVFREILFQVEKKNKEITQLELSKKLNLSLSIVNSAIKKLAKMNAVRIEKMSFAVINIKKIVYYWASFRNLEKDIIFKTRVEMPAREIERNLPDVIFAGYSAYKLRFNDVPADYSEVYAYADDKEIEEIKKRFPENRKIPNLFILKKDENMEKYGKTGTIAQLFVDLWNLKQWYASDFLKAIEEKGEFENGK